MAQNFDGKVAVMTGGASGIGRRTAELVVDQGARYSPVAPGPSSRRSPRSL